MKKSILLFVFFLLLSSHFPLDAFCQDVPKFSKKVKCDVKSDIGNEILSYLNRELRSLDGVIVVDNNPEALLSILAMRTRTRGGVETGVVFSVVIHSILSNDSFKFWLSNAFHLGDERVKDVQFAKDGLYTFQFHSVYLGANDDVRSICQKIVADFDINYLDQDRKNYQALFDQIKKLQQNK